ELGGDGGAELLTIAIDGDLGEGGLGLEDDVPHLSRRPGTLGAGDIVEVVADLEPAGARSADAAHAIHAAVKGGGEDVAGDLGAERGGEAEVLGAPVRVAVGDRGEVVEGLKVELDAHAAKTVAFGEKGDLVHGGVLGDPQGRTGL